MSGNESSQSTNINSLFVLLRVSLGKETEVSLPNDVNWQTVYDIAMKQGVGAIACDGLLKLENIGIDEELRYKWMGQSMVVEQRSSMQWNIACEMAELFSREDIKTIALKGISFASYYPMPLHRSSSDIDISLLDDFERGNQIIESKGFPVDREDSKHSHYVINGIPVENHQFCIGVRGNRRNKRVERRFRQLLRGGGETIGDSKVIRPQWLFNALFFMYHAMNHLLIGGGITLKYICDWIGLRDSVEDKDSKVAFWNECDELGLTKIAQAIDRVCDYIVKDVELDELGSVLLKRILVTKEHHELKSKDQAHLGMIRTMWRNRQMFRDFSDTSAFRMITTYVWGYLFDRNPKL